MEILCFPYFFPQSDISSNKHNFFHSYRDSQVLNASQNEFVKETEVKVYRLLEETPPNGKAFAQTVRHMLKREELWNNWKNEGCKGTENYTAEKINLNIEF